MKFDAYKMSVFYDSYYIEVYSHVSIWHMSSLLRANQGSNSWVMPSTGPAYTIGLDNQVGDYSVRLVAIHEPGKASATSQSRSKQHRLGLNGVRMRSERFEQTTLSQVPLSAHICYVVKFRRLMAMSAKV